MWEKKEECKRVNVCGDSKFGDKCNSSGALKSKKYYKYSIGYSLILIKNVTLNRSIVVGSIVYIIYYA